MSTVGTPLAGTVASGLAAALCWGCSDFSGGLASRRANPASVVVATSAAGLTLLLVLALIWHQPLPRPVDVLWAGLAGLTGSLGLVAFYTALSSTKMGLAAPVSALLTAALPVTFGVFTAGWPAAAQLGGFGLAGIALVLIAGPERGTGSAKALGLAILGGASGGCFFILISRIGPASIFWSLAVSRLVSLPPVLLWIRRQRVPLLPGRATAGLAVLAGILDAAGSVFFVAAALSGPLDVAAVLSSLYPAATVALAALALRERVRRPQAIGILLVLLAVTLISA